jgi:FtsZ-interacting cell division protein ZipA
MTKQHRDIVLGTLASIIMLIIGFFIWKHENAVSQAEAQTNNQIAQQQESDLENELSALQQSSGSSNGFMEGPSAYDDTSGSGNSSANEIATILEAFYGKQNQTPDTGSQPSQPPTSTQPSQPSNGTQPSQPPTSTQPSQPSNGTQPSQPPTSTQPSQPSSTPQNNVRLVPTGFKGVYKPAGVINANDIAQ